MIKRIFAVVLSILMLVVCAGCSDEELQEEWGAPADGETVDDGMDETLGDTPVIDSESNILIVYFSNSGNTHKLTEMITVEYEADVLRLIPAVPYEWETLFDRAQDELNDGIRPELVDLPEADVIAQYDTIMLGFPVWWYDLPMPVWTFLEAYDLSGKTIIPYFTHNGSTNGAASLSTIEELCPDSTVMSDDALSLWGNQVDGSEADVKAWLDGLGLTE